MSTKRFRWDVKIYKQISLSLHSSVTKMYQNLNKSFWWFSMKSDVARYVSNWLVKIVEHQKSSDMLQ